MADNYVEVSQKFDRNLDTYSLRLFYNTNNTKHEKCFDFITTTDDISKDIKASKYTISELKVVKDSAINSINGSQFTSFSNFSEVLILNNNKQHKIPFFKENKTTKLLNSTLFNSSFLADLYYYQCNNSNLVYPSDKDKKISYSYKVQNVYDIGNYSNLIFSNNSTIPPVTKSEDGTSFAYFSGDNKQTYVIRNLKKFNKDALSKTYCSITPIFIGLNENENSKIIDNSNIDSSFKMFGKPEFIPNTKEFTKPKDSKNIHPKDDDINPSVLNKDGYSEISNYTKENLEKLGVFSITSKNTKDYTYFISIEKINNLDVYGFYKIYVSDNTFKKTPLEITTMSKQYPVIVNKDGYLLYLDESDNNYYTFTYYSDTNKLVPHHYPSNAITKLQKISTTTSSTAVDDINKTIDDLLEDNKLQTPFEYYNNLKKSENTEILSNETKGYKKIDIITDSSIKPIVQQKEIPTWFWLDTLKNWCLFRSGIRNNIFTFNSLYVWNGYDGWFNFDRIIRLYQKDKMECRKKSLYDFEEMNLIFSQSWSDTFYDPTDIAQKENETINEKYGIMFKSIKLIGENNYNNHDFETFQNITSKVEYDKDDYDVRRYTIFKGCPNIVRSGNNELFLHYSLKQNYSADIQAHLNEIDKNTIKMYNPGYGKGNAGGSVVECTFYKDSRVYKNELIDLQLYNEDYINSICVNTFGDGSDKTIEDDWHRFTFRKTGSSEIPSESFDSIDIFEDSLVDAAPINTSVIDEEPIKIKFSVNNLYTTNTTTEKTDYAERWDK